MLVPFLLQLKNSLMLGCQYSLIAIGFTLFFGMLNVVVFCHGAFFILASFAGAALLAVPALLPGLPPVFRGMLTLTALFMAMAVGIIIEQLIKLFYP